ncbi:hypothetical protein [Nocardia nepalensis]|uniref:hypothetical protein n=1 Tax=Nocardia nepalensis TaxID=3375448 RepID=UPI003B66B54C
MLHARQSPTASGRYRVARPLTGVVTQVISVAMVSRRSAAQTPQPHNEFRALHHTTAPNLGIVAVLTDDQYELNFEAIADIPFRTQLKERHSPRQHIRNRPFGTFRRINSSDD